MQVSRVSYADGVAFAELSETVEVDGQLLRTPECLSFDLTDDGKIARVEVFTRRARPCSNDRSGVGKPRRAGLVTPVRCGRQVGSTYEPSSYVPKDHTNPSASRTA